MELKMIVCRTCKSWARKKHYCLTCTKCKTECYCRRRAGIGAMVIPRSKSAGIGNSSLVLNSKRAIGLELELSNFGHWNVADKQRGQLPNNGPTYTIAHDGSVRPSQLEAVFDPMAGDHNIIHGLNSIVNHVYVNGCEANDSCGYHVHVDARDFSWTDIQKMLFMWVGIERHATIWNIAGRPSNQFCKYWSDYWPKAYAILPIDIYEFKREIYRKMYGYDIKLFNDDINTTRQSRDYLRYIENCKINKVKPSITEFCVPLNKFNKLKANRGWNRSVDARYLNLNIHSWIYRGTIEYRLGAGTTDIDRLRMWPVFCLWLTEAISRTNLTLIRKYYNDSNSRNINILHKLIDMGGIIIPTINGNKIYEMPTYLKQWLERILAQCGDLPRPQPEFAEVVKPGKPIEPKVKVTKPNLRSLIDTYSRINSTTTYSITTIPPEEDEPF